MVQIMNEITDKPNWNVKVRTYITLGLLSCCATSYLAISSLYHFLLALSSLRTLQKEREKFNNPLSTICAHEQWDKLLTDFDNRSLTIPSWISGGRKC